MEAEPLKIRQLAEADLPAAMSLKRLARWNQTEKDWLRLLKLEPLGCFAACVGQRLVATTTTTRYGTGLAWVGMVLVDPEFRRRGIASLLMKEALGYLEEAGTSTVKLDATPEGFPVYESLGFEKELLVERWQGVARPGSRAGCSPLNESALGELFSFDLGAFGVDRSPLLRTLAADSVVAPLVVTSGAGRVEGYAMAREGEVAAYVGPLVAMDAGRAAALLDAMLGQLAGRRVYIDFHTDFPGGEGMLAERGFEKQRDLVRMLRGRRSAAGTSPLVFSIAGPEVG